MHPQRPVSPTFLLWATQLKREHAFLLERMCKVEAEMQQAKVIVESSQQAQTSAKDLALILEEIKTTLQTNRDEARLNVLRPLISSIATVRSSIEMIASRLSAIQQGQNDVEEQGRKTLATEKSLLQRMYEVEKQQGEYDQNIKQMRHGRDDIQERKMLSLETKIAQLRHYLEQDQIIRASLESKIEALQNITATLGLGVAEVAEGIRSSAREQTKQTRSHLPSKNSMSQALPESALDQLENLGNTRASMRNQTPASKSASRAATVLSAQERTRRSAMEDGAQLGDSIPKHLPLPRHSIALSVKTGKAQPQGSALSQASVRQADRQLRRAHDAASEQVKEMVNTTGKSGRDLTDTSSLSSPPAGFECEFQSSVQNLGDAAKLRAIQETKKLSRPPASATTATPKRRRRVIQQTYELPESFYM